MAIAIADAQGHLLSSAKPESIGGALTPTDVQAAYGLTGLESGGATVAVVDAYGYPALEQDLQVYRATFGLPDCTTSNGCLTIEGNTGGAPPSNSDPTGWDVEQALDVDMVSAACPDCHILVVESPKPSLKGLGKGVNTAAATAGVVAISNSYGGGNGKNTHFYNHKGIAITASTGDDGYLGGLYPAADTHVIAVGGTSVVQDDSARGYSESAWSGAGSGCSKKNPAPIYQQSVDTSCVTDATADVSGPADPNNGGLIIYDSTFGGFEIVGGTSESSPFIASVYALSGKVDGRPGRYPYLDPADLYDITTGSNGACGAPLCDAGVGWDGPTGLGTPHGVGAF